MFDWLRRLFVQSEEGQRRHFFAIADALNAQVGGGWPVTFTKTLGRLRLRSGTLMLTDPMFGQPLDVPDVAADEAELSASLWRYPSGAETITALRIRLGNPTRIGTRRKIGEVAIDSAKLVVADKADINEHWADTGPDRIGLISTCPDDTVLRLLTERFHLRTVRINSLEAQVVDPVSEQLQADIEAFLQGDPIRARFPFMHFRVQTNNSFDRANEMSKSWELMPVGNSPTPLMFVCQTGRGDGCYDVYGEFVEENPHTLTITFIED